MKNLIWRPSARRKYLAAIDYIARRNPSAALRLEDSILREVAMLPRFTALGRPGRAEDTRELVVHPNYIIVYREQTHAIRVIDFLHARQQYP